MHTGSYAWLQAMWVWDRKRKYGLCQKSLWDPDKMSVPSIIIPNFDSYTFFSGDLPNQLIEKTETPFTVKLVYKQMGMSNLLEFEATKDDRGIRLMCSYKRKFINTIDEFISDLVSKVFLHPLI